MQEPLGRPHVERQAGDGHPFLLFHWDIVGQLRPQELPEYLDLTDAEWHSHASGTDGALGCVISGRFPLWFFSAIVTRLATSKSQPEWCCPAWIGVLDPRFGGAVVVVADTQSPQLGEVRPVAIPGVQAAGSVDGSTVTTVNWSGHLTGQASGNSFILRFASPGRDKVSPATLQAALRRVEALLPRRLPELIVLDGQYPSWLASAVVAFLAERCPQASVAVRAVWEGGNVVAYGGEPPTWAVGSLIPDRTPGLPAAVVAIVGDPNSGKSVLSLKLYHHLRAQPDFRCYRIDCDAYAPTTEWTLREHGDQLRGIWKTAKGSWTVEDEQRLAEVLAKLKHSPLDLVLADMPGGNFSVDPPQRIPRTRASLFKLADAFVVVAKHEAALEGWREALAELGLASRIAWVVRPSPKSIRESWPARASKTDHRRTMPSEYHIGLLERTQVYQRTAAIEQLAAQLMAFARRRIGN